MSFMIGCFEGVCRVIRKENGKVARRLVEWVKGSVDDLDLWNFRCDDIKEVKFIRLFNGLDLKNERGKEEFRMVFWFRY